MGNQIAQLQNPDELIKMFLPHFTYCKTISDAPLVKTAMCSTSNEGHIVVKFFMDNLIQQDESKNQQSQIEYVLKAMEEFQSLLDSRKNPNILALIPKIIQKGDQSYLIAYRQFVYFSLLQKSRNKIPKLTIQEKKWLIFQLLCAVSQIHKKGFIHGDIKPDNILISSSNQLFLTDFVCYKPAYVDADDLKSYTQYFGELENQNRCYFAPERFCELEYNKNLRDNSELKKSMDIFSVGCVIAEILMDGVPLFDRSGLFSYKRQTCDPRITLKKKIHEPALVELIMNMINLQENERPTVDDSLAILFGQNIMQNSFQKSFFQINSTFVRPLYLFSDMKISLLRKYMPQIWKLCFSQKQIPKFLEPVEREILLAIIDDGIIEHNNQIIPGIEQFQNNQQRHLNLFEFLDIQDQKMDNDKSDVKKSTHQINEERDSAIIVINWIGIFMPTCFFPQIRRCALEMLMLIGKESSLQVRLQIILPYILKMFEDKQPKVQAKAIEAAVLIFENLIQYDPNDPLNQEKLTLSSMDYYVFNSFIMPQFKILFDKKQYKDIQIIQLALSKYLPMLSKIGQRFTELSVASRLQRKNHLQPDKQFQQENDQIEESESQFQADEDIKIQDQEIKEDLQSQQNNKAEELKKHNEHEHIEAQVNFDQDLDIIRREFIKIISDYVSSNDSSIKRMIFSKIGQQCDFYGSKMTMDSLIPLLSTCANEKEFKIKIDCLKSVIVVGIKVGKQAFNQKMLPLFRSFLNDPDELVVLQFIRTLSSLIKMSLIQKQALFTFNENQDSDQSLLVEMLPLLLHPNCWIREEILNLLINLFDFQNSKILNKTETFCLLRNKLEQFLNHKTSIYNLINQSEFSSSLFQILKHPLSRTTFEMCVQANTKNNDNLLQINHSQSDSFALEKMNNLLKQIKLKNYQKLLMQGDQQKKNSTLNKKDQQRNLYHINKIKILDSFLSNQQKYCDITNFHFKNANNQDFTNEYFAPCSQFKLDFNQISNKGLSEIDFIMQALNFHPEDKLTDTSQQQNDQLQNEKQIQSLLLDWRLQFEKTNVKCKFPSENPQSNLNNQKTTQSEKEIKQQADRSLIREKTMIDKFRPKGRLITTLHEHNHPVTSVAVTNDQSMFITASREDGRVNIWNTFDVLKDPTSHSKQTFDLNITNCKINKVCSVQNSNQFCLIGSEGNLQFYDMNRLSNLEEVQGKNKKDSSLEPPQKNKYFYKLTNQDAIHQNEGDLITCLNTILPISNQHVLTYTSQKGSFFMHDLRCKRPFLKQSEIFGQQKGMITCMSIGQDPYQIICGSIGGYISVYDIRFNLISSQFKYSQKYPITSIAAFKPQDKLEIPNQSLTYNKSQFFDPMALVSLGGPTYELSLVNLDTGNIEILMTVNDQQNNDNSNQQVGITVPSFFRESLIRDSYSWPEKSENNSSLIQRIKMQKNSLINSQQNKLYKNIDDELFKNSKFLYQLLKDSSESQNSCRKILIPRSQQSLLQSTYTVDYAITGGNDKRLRYWNLTDPTNQSYYINTPNNDECQHFQSQLGGGILYIQEQISKIKNFPKVNANIFSENSIQQKQPSKLIPGSVVEMADESPYYNMLYDMIKSNDEYSQDNEGLKSCIRSKSLLSQSQLNEITMKSSNRYQLEIANDKVKIYNYNGLSEWQHFNGINLNEGNSSLVNSSYNDKWSNSKKSNHSSNQGNPKVANNEQFQDSHLKQYRQGDIGQAGDFDDKNSQSLREYVYRESQNVSHSDAILDMEILEVKTDQQIQNTNILITCSRDCTIKLWQ